MNHIMRSLFRILTLSAFTLLFSCEKKKEIDLGYVKPVTKDKSCIILSNFRTDGQQYEFVYESTRLQKMKGFLDFDTFVYSGDKLTKAYHTNNKGAEILFDFDSKDLLKKIVFQGKDSQGKAFSYTTIITHNVIGKIESLLLHWPTFPNKIESKFSYDANGNVKLISALIDNEWKTLLENKTFDDKKSPYRDQRLGQVLSYYMVYTLLGGGFNFTQYLNTNNVTTAVVTKGEDKINYLYDYKYNTNSYPTEMNYTRTMNNRPTSYIEKFSYDCPL